MQSVIDTGRSIILAESSAPNRPSARSEEGLEEIEPDFRERMAMLPNDVLWTLLLVGGRFAALDALRSLLSVPLDTIVDDESIPDEVRSAVREGDVAVQRRLILALLIRWQWSGKHANKTQMGGILTNAVMGKYECHFPALLEDLARRLPHDDTGVYATLVAPEIERLRLAGPKEDTRRYFEVLDPWYIKLGRWLRRRCTRDAARR